MKSHETVSGLLKKLLTKLIGTKDLAQQSTNSHKPILMSENPKYSKYEIGEWTYGNPVIRSWDDRTKLKIGKFCSIASNVQLILGGEHRTDWITTYPFNEIFDEAKHYSGHPATKGHIVIGNDVWIGQDAIILSGVSIGNGAVIGAGSIVAKDIPSYAIVVGNPAKIIRFRFSDSQIDKLERIGWWNWPLPKILDALNILLGNDINLFIEKYSSDF